MMVEEYQSSGTSRIRSQQVPKERPAALARHTFDRQPEFRDHSCYMTKLKCALVVVMCVLLFGGNVAWLTVVVSFSKSLC